MGMVAEDVALLLLVLLDNVTELGQTVDWAATTAANGSTNPIV